MFKQTIERKTAMSEQQATKDFNQMVEAFAHTHVNNPESEHDDCRECGLDLRHPVHYAQAHMAQQVKRVLAPAERVAGWNRRADDKP